MWGKFGTFLVPTPPAGAHKAAAVNPPCPKDRKSSGVSALAAPCATRSAAVSEAGDLLALSDGRQTFAGASKPIPINFGGPDL
jgi:hypothetical protein